ncbi:MAG: hypothetical protein ABSG60_11190 [Terracidiphilus sp.]
MSGESGGGFRVQKLSDGRLQLCVGVRVKEDGCDMTATAEEEGLTAADVLEKGCTDETDQRRAGPGHRLHLHGAWAGSSALRSRCRPVTRCFRVTSLCSHRSTSTAEVRSHELSA